MLFGPIYYHQTVKISWGLSETLMSMYIKGKLFYKIRKLSRDSIYDFTRCKTNKKKKPYEMHLIFTNYFFLFKSKAPEIFLPFLPSQHVAYFLLQYLTELHQEMEFVTFPTFKS